MIMEFVVGAAWEDSGCRLVYRESEHSFDVEMRPAGGVTSLLVNDLQLEIDQEGVVLYPWGLCPRTAWDETDASPPRYSKGTLIAQTGREIVPGVSIRISGPVGWSVYLNKQSGWVCIGDPKPSVNETNAVEFAPGCVAVLSDGSLIALWLHPS